MLQAKFQNRWPPGSKEYFFKIFVIDSHDGHLGHVIMAIYANFHSFCIKFGFDWLSGFRKEDV